MNLSTKLLTLVFGGMTAIAIIVSSLVYNFTNSILGDAVKQNQLSIAQQTMGRIDRELYQRNLEIQTMAGDNMIFEALKLMAGAPSNDSLFRLKELTTVTGPWHNLFIVNSAGKIVASTDENYIGQSILQEPQRGAAFTAAMNGYAYHSDLVRLKDLQRDTVMFSAPVRDRTDYKHPVIGAIIGGFIWPVITEMLQEIPVLPSVHAAIINQEGKVIASNAIDKGIISRDFKEKLFAQDPFHRNSGSIYLAAGDSLSGSESLVSYAPQLGFLSFNPNNWTLILEVPYNIALAPAHRAAVNLVLFLLPIFVGKAIALHFLISRMVTKPLSCLQQTMHKITIGDAVEKAAILSNDEIGKLAHAFNAMLDHLTNTTVSRDWLEVMVGSIGDAVIATDKNAIVTFMNKEAERLTGWHIPDVINKLEIAKIFPIINVKTGEKAENPVIRVLREGAVVGLANHTFLIRRDGSQMPIDDSAAPIRNTQGALIGTVLVFRDVSEKYRRDEELINSEKKFRAVTDSTADAIVSIDSQGHIVFWNRSASKIFGYGDEEIRGCNLTCLMPEKFRELHNNGLARLLQTGEKRVIGKTVELVGLRKSGEEFPLELTLSMWEKEEEILFTGTLRDISQRKVMEKEREELEVQLRGAQKLEAIGQLAAGIAHEINTPIQYISDNTKFLETSFESMLDASKKIRMLTQASDCPSSKVELAKTIVQAYDEADLDYLISEIPNAISQSLEGAARVSEIVRAMKEFSHPGYREKTSVDINRALQTTITVSKNEWKYAAEMETDFDPELKFVPCIPGEINQVFLNLIVNAAHAIQDKANGSGKGKIKIRTKNLGEWAEISIEDSGSGIPDDIRARIFNPFFTTKAVGKGTGQGLAIARSIVVGKHHGSITFNSEVGVGTTFIIKIPLERTPA